MGRIARSRTLYDGCYAHVFSRSIEKRKIFKDKKDFGKFYGFLLSSKKKYDFKVFHYCLMPTHFHLAVKVNILLDFSEALQRVKWNYTKFYNEKYSRRGPLWRERFKSLLIEHEGYLYSCGRYIEENPVKDKLIDRKQNWVYSSSQFYEMRKEDDLVDIYRFPEQGIEEREEIEFEKGSVIGTELFKYKHRKGLA